MRHTVPRRLGCRISGIEVASQCGVRRCAVLFVGRRAGDPQAEELRVLGFSVTERDVLPDDSVLLEFPVVVLTGTSITSLPMIATRLRAKAGFGRRVIIARVHESTLPATIRSLQLCGLDEAFVEPTPTRIVAARIIRRLRERPELRCIYPDISSSPAA